MKCGRVPVIVLAGRWEVSTSGVWEFVTDTGKLCRCINIARCGGVFTELEKLIMQEFGKQDDTTTIKISYWIPERMTVLSQSKNPPIGLLTDAGLEMFLDVQEKDKSVNLFVEFNHPVKKADSNPITEAGQLLRTNLEITSLDDDVLMKHVTMSENLMKKRKASKEASMSSTDGKRRGERVKKKLLFADHNTANGSVDSENEKIIRLCDVPAIPCEENERYLANAKAKQLKEKRKKDGDSKGQSSRITNNATTKNGSSITSKGKEICQEKEDPIHLGDMSNLTDGGLDFNIQLGQSTSTAHGSDGKIQEVDVHDMVSREEDETSTDGSSDYSSNDSYDGEEEDYDFDYWTRFVNNDCEEPVPSSAEAEAIQVLTDLPKYVEVTQEAQHITGETSTRCNDSGEFPDGQNEVLNMDIVMVDAPPVFEEFPEGQNEVLDMDISLGDDGIYKGRVFTSKKHLQFIMSSYAIKRLFHYKQPRSTKKKVVFTCFQKTCGWYVMAKREPNSDFYKLKNVILQHECNSMSRDQFSKHATAKVISQLMKSRYVSYENFPKARDIPDIVMQDLHLSVSYSKSWRVKELSISATHGAEEASYAELPTYNHLLKKYNPGSIAELQTVLDKEGNTRFQYLFIAMGASIQGIEHLRKVVVIDETFLTGKFKGCLMTACMQDGNFQIFPIAFGVVDGENDGSWEWFFKNLYKIVGEYSDLYLEKIGLERWTRVHCTGKRYNMMSSNIAETWNGVIEAAKDLPIIAMLDKIRIVLIRWFTMRRKIGAKHKTTNTPEVEKRLLQALNNPPKYVIGVVSCWGIEVRSESGRTYHVNLEEKTCSCRVFDELKIPCSHAIAAALATRVPISNFPGDCFDLPKWVKTYLGDMVHVPESADEEIDESITSVKILPPNTRVPPGRRRKKRIKSTGEYGGEANQPKSKNKCGRCGRVGHNRVTCKNAI